MFSDAPVDSDMFMSYLHHNYPLFCDDIENTDHLMNYISVADSLMRMEGDNVGYSGSEQRTLFSPG